MLEDTELSLDDIKKCLDELTNEEYRVFIEYFMFKTSKTRISQIVQRDKKVVAELCCYLENEKEHLMPLKKEISEAFFL